MEHCPLTAHVPQLVLPTFSFHRSAEGHARLTAVFPLHLREVRYFECKRFVGSFPDALGIVSSVCV